MQGSAYAEKGCTPKHCAQTAQAHSCFAPLPCSAAGRLDLLQELQHRGLDLGGRAGCTVLAAAVHSGAAPLMRWLVRPGGCNVTAALKQVRGGRIGEWGDMLRRSPAE